MPLFPGSFAKFFTPSTQVLFALGKSTHLFNGKEPIKTVLYFKLNIFELAKPPYWKLEVIACARYYHSNRSQRIRRIIRNIFCSILNSIYCGVNFRDINRFNFRRIKIQVCTNISFLIMAYREGPVLKREVLVQSFSENRSHFLFFTNTMS